jgi:hypothetical protein
MEPTATSSVGRKFKQLNFKPAEGADCHSTCCPAAIVRFSVRNFRVFRGSISAFPSRLADQRN